MVTLIKGHYQPDYKCSSHSDQLNMSLWQIKKRLIMVLAHLAVLECKYDYLLHIYAYVSLTDAKKTNIE